MNRKVKILSCILAIAMIVSLTSICAFAWYKSSPPRTDISGFTCYATVSGVGAYCTNYTTITSNNGGSGVIGVYADVVTNYTDGTYDYAYASTLYGGEYMGPGDSIQKFVDSTVNSQKTVDYFCTQHLFSKDSTSEYCSLGFTIIAGEDF